MSDLAAALLEALDDDAIDRLAQRLAPRLAGSLAAGTGPEPDRWLNTREAAGYIGRSTSATHKLTAARAIPFAQAGPGARCYFRRSDLDAWMRSR
jgi:excisionase family DNA binding protein